MSALNSDSVEGHGEFQSFLHWLEQGLDYRADESAFEWFDKYYSVYDLDELSTRFAAYLQSGAGLVPGNMIAIDLLPSAAGSVAFYAAIRTGLSVLLFSTDHTPGQKQKALSEVQPSLTVKANVAQFEDAEVLVSGQIKPLLLKQCLVKGDPGCWKRPNFREQGDSVLFWLDDDGHIQRCSTVAHRANLPDIVLSLPSLPLLK